MSGNFEDKIHCSEECWQIIHSQTCSVSGEGIANQPPKLPQFPVAHNTVDGEIRIGIYFLCGYQLSETLPPALLKIVFLRFNESNENNQGGSDNRKPQFRSCRDKVIWRAA